MTPPELMALSLIGSVLASAAAWGAAVLIERGSRDPRLRDAVWGGGLLLGLLPVLAVALMLLSPAPVREVVATATIPEFRVEAAAVPAPVVSATPIWPTPAGLGRAALAAAGFLGLIRLVALALRILRLARLIARATPVDAPLQTRIDSLAGRLGVRAPDAVVSAAAGETLLAGLGRPRLILPVSGKSLPDAIILHELAHLKRADHRTLWLEEAIAVVLAFNPLIPLLRARRDAAREEACDALALTGADPEARRAYARTLIQALRDRAGPASASGGLVALTFTGAGRTTAMHRLNAVMNPAAPAGRRVRGIAAGLVLGLVVGAGSASWAIAAHRPVETVVRAGVAAAPPATDFAWVSAALDPVYKAAWPEACGFGAEGDGRIFVHAGACETGDGSRLEILSLAGVAFSTDARAAFTAVKAACDAGRPVEIAYAENGARARRSVACLSAAVAPPEPVRFTVDLSYDPAIRIAAGDRLEIELKRDMEQGGTASTGIVLDLAPGAMPGQAFADLRPPLLPTDLRNGPMFALSARIVGSNGVVKAVSDRDLDRPHAPYVQSAAAISTAMRMLPADGQAASAARMAVDSAGAALPPETAARFRRASASDYQRYCASGDSVEEGFCAGVLFASLGGEPKAGFCLPENLSGNRAAISAYLARAKAEIARLSPRRDEGAYEYSERALRRAYPCQAVAAPAAAARTYQARISISENGRLAASDRLRLLPNGDASTVLTVDGVGYRFQLRLSEAERGPEGQALMDTNAHVERALPSGGWKTTSRPRLTMRADGQARMTWGEEAGLLFDIVVEPA